MTVHLNIYTVTVLLAAILSFALTIKGLSRRETATTGWFSTFMAEMFVWSFAYLFELSSGTFQHVLFWSRFEYLGAPFIAPTWLSLVLSYTGKLGSRKSSKNNLLFVVPVLSAIFAWTNGYHHLIWQHPYLLQEDLFSTLNFTPGIWYIINITYSYALFILATLILFLSYFKTSPVFRWQIILLLAFSITNWLANLAYMFRIMPAHFDLTPVIFSFSSIPLAIVIFKNSFFSIAPIAREVIMDTIKEPILVLNKEKTILDFNMEAKRISGLDADKIRGTYAPEVFPDIVTETILEKMNHIEPDGFEEVFAYDTPDTFFIYRMKISPLYGEHSQKHIIGYIIIMNDITRISRYAEELEQKNAELESFSYMVAHDIKNPLNTILGFSSILAEKYTKISTDAQKEMIASIYQGGLKLDSIVNELFLLSRISISEKLELVPVDMGRIISTVITRLHQLISETGAIIHKPDQWEPIASYPPWIEQVWINYISNAIKYGGKPPVIELQEKKGGESIQYFVNDNGRGIDENERKQLFIPFTRLQKERAEGTGLGLTIVKRIIEKLGGTFGMVNRETGGAQFYFTLPKKRN